MSYHPTDEPASPAATTAAAVEPAAPTRFGRYELLGQLATGGMAEIHLARLAGEAGFEKIVVVKRLLPELVASKAFVAMFLDEGKLVARLDHPNVCEVHELGREGAEYFLVMPFLDGVPATDFIARPRESDRIAQLRVAAGIITQASAGLHHAHELRDSAGALLGLVHRDVSPSNLFITTAGVVKVLDFGVAKVRGAAETEAGTIKGKTEYMAPQQLLGEPLDRRCDVFALGIVLFELATHQRLFKRSSDYLAARAILEDPIPRADAVDPAVPAALADVIARALEGAPADRFGDARELGRAIDAAMVPHNGVANAEQIADALANWHGEQLSAVRTRQARVLDDARSRTNRVRAIGSNAATAPRGSNAATAPREIRAAVSATLARSRRRVKIRAAVGLAAIGATVVLALSQSDPPDKKPLRAAVPTNVTANVPIDAMPTPDATTPSDVVAVEPIAKPARPASKEPGLFSIESTPFATIYVDDKYFGVTPLVRKSLPAGRHRIKAVLKDGRSKALKIDVPAGKLARPVVLTW